MVDPVHPDPAEVVPPILTALTAPTDELVEVVALQLCYGGLDDGTWESSAGEHTREMYRNDARVAIAAVARAVLDGDQQPDPR